MTKTYKPRRFGEPVQECLWCGDMGRHAPFLIVDEYTAETTTKNGVTTRPVKLTGRLCTVCEAIHAVSAHFRRQISLKMTLKLIMRRGA